MSLQRYSAKRDANEKAIVDAFRLCGCSVQHLSGKGVPDLVVGYQGITHLVEVKTRKGRVTMDQETWKMRWNGSSVSIARSVEDALRLFRSWQR